MPTKKTKTAKTSAKAKEKLTKEAGVKKKATKKTQVKAKAVATKKTAAKKTTKLSAKKVETKKKATTKTTSAKVTKKTAKKTVAKAPKAKKTTEKTTKASVKKDVESSAKTAAKIIAKAKKGNTKKASEKIQDTTQPVADKKNDPQKNVIYVKKLSDSRNKVVFKAGDYAVYPSHGVGKIVDVEKTTILGQDFHCYLMFFEKEKLTIKIPTISAEKIGLRHLATKAQMDEVFLTLRSGIKKLKGMWSRRAQEYETKINSGDIMLLAEVLRDLTRDIEDGERSYSERIIYETAVFRLAAEYSVIYGCDFEESKEKVISTAKDKLGVEGKITQKDEFDEFDYDDDLDDDEDDEDDEDMDDDEDDEMYGDDAKPQRRSRG